MNPTDENTNATPARRLPGAWELLAWKIHYDDGRAAGLPFGDQPNGQLLYSPDGWMSATVSRSDRPALPANQSPRQVDDAIMAQAYRSYFHYAGHWHIEGDSVIHTIRLSLNPNMVGTRQHRQMQFSGELLTLTGAEPLRGTLRTHQLIWRRADARTT